MSITLCHADNAQENIKLAFRLYQQEIHKNVNKWMVAKPLSSQLMVYGLSPGQQHQTFMLLRSEVAAYQVYVWECVSLGNIVDASQMMTRPSPSVLWNLMKRKPRCMRRNIGFTLPGCEVEENKSESVIP
eukprot:scaffold1313_cov349-Pavlova_lutheri.AAC.11